MVQHISFTIKSNGRHFYDLTHEINQWIAKQQCHQGLCNIFIHHTSASLIISENTDPAVQQDLETFFAQLVPDGMSHYIHNQEGPDDMPAHIRSILTQSSINVPIIHSRLALGTWQGIYLWEHRTQPHNRQITLTLIS